MIAAQHHGTVLGHAGNPFDDGCRVRAITDKVTQDHVARNAKRFSRREAGLKGWQIAVNV